MFSVSVVSAGLLNCLLGGDNSSSDSNKNNIPMKHKKLMD